MSTRKKRRGRKKKKIEKPKTPPPEIIEEEDDEGEEEGEEEEVVFVPLIWRLADENDSHGVLKLIQDAEIGHKTKKKEGEEEGEEEEVIEDEEEEEEEESGEVEYDEEGNPIKKESKKADKEEEEPLMTLDELLETRHPLFEYSLLDWACRRHHPHIIRKLISFRNSHPQIFGFTNPKWIRIVKLWTKELLTLNKLKLAQAVKLQVDVDSEGEESENEEEGEERPDFFETMSADEKISTRELQSLCKLGVYEGPMKSIGIRDGFGRSIYPNGDVYVGDFKDHKKHGFGVYIYSKGGYYIGRFFQNMKDGLTSFMLYPDGSVYQGSFSNDCRRGYGRFRYPSGDFYYGSFSDDMKSGYGTYEFHAHSSFYDGKWKDGKFVSGLWQMKCGMVYSGEYDEATGQPSGLGVYYYPNKGVKQVGEYRKKKMKKVESEEEEGTGGMMGTKIGKSDLSHSWEVHSNENMDENDFKFLAKKKKDRTIVCVVTGRNEVGKKKLMKGLQKVTRSCPSIVFLRRITTKHQFGDSDTLNESIEPTVFREARDQGGLYYSWEAEGYDVGLPAETILELKKLRGTKIIITKIEKVTKEFMTRLKSDFVTDSREVREVKLLKIVTDEKVMKKRLKKVGMSDTQIDEILEENKKLDEEEAKEGLGKEMIKIDNNEKLSKSVSKFLKVISLFDKQNE